MPSITQESSMNSKWSKVITIFIKILEINKEKNQGLAKSQETMEVRSEIE